VLQEFKDFINKGNIVEIAVGLVMAVAFVPIVDAFVTGVLMQIIAAIVGEPNFNALTIDVSDTSIFYGRVITTTVNFIFVALAVFFVLKAYNATRAEEEGESGPSEIDLLTEIRDSLANR